MSLPTTPARTYGNPSIREYYKAPAWNVVPRQAIGKSALSFVAREPAAQISPTPSSAA